jgi:hypothetical protein
MCKESKSRKETHLTNLAAIDTLLFLLSTHTTPHSLPSPHPD